MNAGVLHCPTCGAAASSDATHCAYCRARLQTVACASCFGMMFLGSKFCPHCGAPAVQAPAVKTPLPCPRCALAMQQKSLSATTLLECAKCGGLWMSADAFQKICADREQEANALGQYCARGARVSVEANVRYAKCPQCQSLMNRVNFARISGVIIDICTSHGIWFDRDELRKIVEFVRAGGLDRARWLQSEKLSDAQRHIETMKSVNRVDDAPESSGTSGGGWADILWVIAAIALAAMKFMR